MGSTVLVVEDDHEILAGVQEMLTDAGYDVATAHHGQEAMAYLESRPVPAAIVVDLMMPLMNGWDLVNRVRANPRLAAIPVVVVTATGPHWGYPVDASLVVRKPFQRQHLLNLIRKVTAPAPAAPPPVQ